MQSLNEQHMNLNDSTPQLQLANITIGTNAGPSVLYSRSKRSIHQHAMKVSLRERTKIHERAPAQTTVESQPPTGFMNRFRANPSAPKKRGTSRKSKVQEQGARSAPAKDEEVGSVGLIRLPPPLQTPAEYFPIDVGLEASYLNRLLETSLFGQVPYIICPELAPLEYAIQDQALLNGMLALASLGRDMDKDLKASALCLRLKGKTIQAVRQRLLEDPSNITIGTIGAIASLAAFDLLECLGRNEPRPDNMTFLHLAVTRQGGLRGLMGSIVDNSTQCSMLKRVILWLDLSFAIMDGTPSHFAFHDSPIQLASTALHTVSLHMTPLTTVFAELSHLSRSVDEGLPTGRERDGDQVSGLEQRVAGLSTNELAWDVLEVLRITTFLYSARYFRRFSSNSRFQMQLASRLQTCLGIHFKKDINLRQLELGSQLDSFCWSTVYQPIILWTTTTAAASSGAFQEICGRDHHERRTAWTEMIADMLQSFEIATISQVEATVDSLTHDTILCRKERRILLKACGIPEV